MRKNFYSSLLLATIFFSGAPDLWAINWPKFSVGTSAPKCTPPETPPTSPVQQANEHPLKLKASFIYWQPIQAYMDIAYEGSGATLNSLAGFNFVNGRVIYFDHAFEPGFQLGAAYRFNNRWDLLADYTFFHANESRSASQLTDGFLYSRWIPMNLISDNAVSRISAKWHLALDVVNLEAAKELHFGKHFSLTPHIGLAGVSIAQQFKGHFTMISPTVEHLIGLTSTTSFGIGPRMGVIGNCKISSHFSFQSNIASDLLFTRYGLKIHYKNKANTIWLKQANNLHTIRPELEMYLGMSLDFPRWHIGAGYDFQIWWNQNMIRWYSNYTAVAVPEGNLYFQGLRLTFQADF
jgi:hypothetical protein